MKVPKEHSFEAAIAWTGNRGEGTSHYRAYDRTWSIVTPGKAHVECSNDPLLGGDPAKHNPEDLLLASLSACHMLWYLHLASKAGILVRSYEDDPIGVGETLPNGAGRFLRATLRPKIELDPTSDVAVADALHQDVHNYCFIARSVSFPVAYEASYTKEGAAIGA
jgi:organic hydroperoxide reductase OsmC/OhrA